MPREWLSDEEQTRSAKTERKLRLEAWACGVGLAALVLIGLSAVLGWR